MTKAELIAAVKERAGLGSKAEAERAIDGIIEVLKDELVAGKDVAVYGFGSFRLVDRPGRVGRNPRTGKEITIAASKAVKFTPAAALKSAVN